MNPTGRTTKTTDDTGTYTTENDTLSSNNPNGEKVSAPNSTAQPVGTRGASETPERIVLHDDGDLEVMNGQNDQNADKPAEPR